MEIFRWVFPVERRRTKCCCGHKCGYEVNQIMGRIAQLKEIMMATFDELKAQMEQTNVAIAEANVIAADSNARLDAVNVKIDDLIAQVANGGVVSQAQLDELSGLASAAATSTADLVANLQGIVSDVTDAEQS